MGLSQEGQSKLRVSSAWGRSRHQLERGKFGSVVARPAMKWFLEVQMARSAELRWWMWGGTSWYSTFSAVRKALRIVEASLSSVWRRGRSPRMTK